MYKECFEISKHVLKKDTISRELFFKNYLVFDGLGSVYFWTLQEARKYVVIKAKQMQGMFEYAVKLYGELSFYYSRRLVQFRCYSAISHKVNSY